MSVVRSLLEVLFSLVVAVVNHSLNVAMLIAHHFWTIFLGSQWPEYFVEGKLDVAFQFWMRMKAQKKGVCIAACMYIALHISWCLILRHLQSIRYFFFQMDYQKWLLLLELGSYAAWLHFYVKKPGYDMQVFLVLLFYNHKLNVSWIIFSLQ